MNNKKRVTIGLLLLTLAMVLAGCGGISKKKEQAARELIDKMITAADGAVVSKSDCTVDFETKMLFGSEEAIWGSKSETHNEYDKKSGRADSEVTFYVNEEPRKARFHMAEEQGVFYIYGKKEDTDWIKYDTCFLKDDMSRNFVSDMNLENAEIVDFMKDYKKVDGKNAHWLSVRLKDASIRELLFEAGFKVLFWGSEYNSIDLSDVDVLVDYYVDPDTAQVVELEVKLDGMKNFFKAYVELYNNFDFEEEYKDTEINRGKLIYTNISYEDINVPMLSFEDKKSSHLVYQVDTVYNLKVMEAEVDVTCPKGWYIAEKSTNNIKICRFDGKKFINYTLYFPATKEEMEEGIAADVEFTKEEGTYVSDKKGPQIGDFDTYEIEIKDGITAYAYTTLNRALFLVYVIDYTTNTSNEILPEILDTVKCNAIEW